VGKDGLGAVAACAPAPLRRPAVEQYRAVGATSQVVTVSVLWHGFDSLSVYEMAVNGELKSVQNQWTAPGSVH
jgi:hypothetical protein